MVGFLSKYTMLPKRVMFEYAYFIQSYILCVGLCTLQYVRKCSRSALSLRIRSSDKIKVCLRKFENHVFLCAVGKKI